MSKDTVYEKLLWEQIEEHIPHISKKEARFRQVDKIPSIGAFMKYYENDCSDCMLHKKEVENVISNLPEILKHKGAYLDKKMQTWTSHLKNKHGVYPDYYFNYRYATYGLLLGLAIGISLVYIFKGKLVFAPIGVIVSITLIIGVVYGSILDNKVKKQGKKY